MAAAKTEFLLEVKLSVLLGTSYLGKLAAGSQNISPALRYLARTLLMSNSARDRPMAQVEAAVPVVPLFSLPPPLWAGGAAANTLTPVIQIRRSAAVRMFNSFFITILV
jgi:hypothetical protein